MMSLISYSHLIVKYGKLDVSWRVKYKFSIINNRNCIEIFKKLFFMIKYITNKGEEANEK